MIVRFFFFFNPLILGRNQRIKTVDKFDNTVEFNSSFFFFFKSSLKKFDFSRMIEKGMKMVVSGVQDM